MVWKLKCWIFSLEKSHIPTPNDLKDQELKKVAKTLKGNLEKETLTNILEWQERNISFWWERWPFNFSLKILVPITWLLIFFISLPFAILLFHYYPTFLIPFLAALLLLFLIFLVSETFFRLFYLFLSLPLMYLLIGIIFRFPKIAQAGLPYILFYAGCLGAITIISVYLFIRYRVFLREKSGREKLSKFIEIVDDTFRVNLPASKILEYHLAVCRDYAKLTAALLFNLYPESEVYFFKFLGHVAAVIKINDKYYVLDQKLPVLTKDGWLKAWNKKEACVYSAQLQEGSEKIISKKQGKVVLSDHSEKTVNTIDLTKEVAKIMNLKQMVKKEKPDLKILMKDFAVYYEDDDIVKYSLIRAIKNKLESKLCSNMDRVSKIEISQNGKDLLAKIYTNMNKQREY